MFFYLKSPQEKILGVIPLDFYNIKINNKNCFTLEYSKINVNCSLNSPNYMFVFDDLNLINKWYAFIKKPSQIVFGKPLPKVENKGFYIVETLIDYMVNINCKLFFFKLF